MKNTVIKMESLPKATQYDVRSHKTGTFRNTFVLDKGTLYIFTKEGECHYTDPEIADELVNFGWYVDKEGYAATDDLPHIRKGIRLHSFVYIFYSMPPIWYVDRNGKRHRDWSMAEFLI